MNIFAIDTATSYAAVSMLRILANSGITFKRALLNVKGMPTTSKNSEDWPLIFDCRSDDPDCKFFQICIHTLTCGYRGTGPNNLVECLQIAGFGELIDEEEIFTEKVIVKEYQK